MEQKFVIINSTDISRIAKNAGISGIGEIVSNIFGYATSIVITRTVGPYIFGVFSLANIITWIAQVFSSIGLNEGLLRFVAFYKGKGDTPRVKGSIIFGTKVVFSLSIFFAVVLFYLADLIGNKFFHNPDVSFALKILVISLPFLTLEELWLKVIQSFQIIKYQVFVQKFFQPVVRLLAIAILFLMGFKLVGILVASIIAICTASLLSLYYLLKISQIHKEFPHPKSERKEIIFFSLPLSLSQLLGIVTFYIDALMLGYFKTATEVGIYSAVSRVGMLILVPLTSFNTIFAPMISEIYSKNEMKRLEDLFKTVTKWIFLLSLPLFLLFILLAEQIMGFFGQDFVVGSVALIIFGAGELINAGVGSVGYMLMMTGRSKIVLFNSLVFCALNIVLNYILIPKYSIVGAAIGTGSSIAVINILRVIEVYYFMKIQPFKIDYLKPCIAGVLSFFLINIVIYKIPPVSIFSMAVISFLFISSYTFFIYLFRLENEDKYILKLIYQKILDVMKGSSGAKQ
jgi:O-antigen/teichoic acid export membrane protein